MNELLTTEGTWLLEKSQFSVVSWPDLVSTKQCFNRFASFISISKWSEEISRGQRTKFSLPFALSLQQGPQISNLASIKSCKLNVYRGQVSDVNEGIGWDRMKGNVCLFWTAESKPRLYSPHVYQNPCVPSRLTTDCQHATPGLHGWLLLHADTRLNGSALVTISAVHQNQHQVATF